MSAMAPELARESSTRGRTRARLLMGLVVLAGVLALLSLVSLAVGSKPIAIGTTWRVLWEPDGSNASVVIRELRIPRTVLGLLVGASLGVAGALMQGHTRNPLADPGLLGVTAGASLAVVMSIRFLGIGSAAGYVWFALLGAAIASVVVFAIGSMGSRAPNPLALVLAGAAVSALLLSLTSAVLLGNTETIDQYRFWVVGSLAGRDLSVAADVAPFLVVGMLVAIAHGPALNLLSLGDGVAKSLGQHIGWTRAIGLTATMLLAGAATAACGPIAFVGLVVPHLARIVTGPDYRFLIPYAGLVGASLLLAADTVGRVVARPGELQVGIVLALIGGPFFIALVRRRRLVSL